MRVLVLTKIFPNSCEPHSSPFNRQQFAALSKLCDVDVLATIPWFPGAGRFARWSRAGRLGAVPDAERIAGLSVRHPRFVYVPKIGTPLSGSLYAASLAPHVLAFRGRVDVLLGSWAYPDGYAAVALGRRLGVPVVVKVHGSDINVLGRRLGARHHLKQGLSGARRVVAVSRPLALRVAELGVPPNRIDVVPNGVDTSLFFPRERSRVRRELGLAPDEKIVLFVGRIEPEKGVLDLVHAMASVASQPVTLWMVGEGSATEASRQLAERSGVTIRFTGARPHSEVAKWMGASDVVALPSHDEGMPNTVLEALASARWVVASRVGGIPDLISSRLLGELVAPRHPRELAAALERGLGRAPDPLAERPRLVSWHESAELLLESLSRALEPSERKAA